MLQTLLSGLLAFGLCAAAILLGRLVRFLAARAAKGARPQRRPRRHRRRASGARENRGGAKRRREE